jgi:mannose PTS system EIIA component
MKNRILIIAHEPLASALRNCAAHVFPDKMQDILALDVAPGATPQHSLQQAQQLLGSDSSSPLLVLTDMLGATPCSVAAELARGRVARVVAGANMPMLLRAATYQDLPLAQLVERALAGGVQGVLEVK